jgi:DNA-binding transcriptional ArsR family regulator
MSEEQPTYGEQADALTENGYVSEAIEMLGRGYNQPAAIIDPPRNIKALSDKGLVNYSAWGWVKMSAKFIDHVKELRGAKLAIWLTISLSIDETGKCKRTIRQLCELTGYSHTEVIDSLKELDEAGYLSTQKDGRGNIYAPEFAARGELKPSDETIKKLESSPLDSSGADSLESSSSSENARPSIKSIKRVNTGFKKTTKQDLAVMNVEAAIYAGLEVSQETIDREKTERDAANAFESAFGITRPWDWWTKQEWRELLALVVHEYQSDKSAFVRYVEWVRVGDGRYGKGIDAPQIQRDPTRFYVAWDVFKAQDKSQTKLQSLEDMGWK